MTIYSRWLLGSAVGVFLALGMAAQDKAPNSSARPRVLVIQREFVKPGKGGAVHEKAESAFVQAMARAKWPTHYVAMQAMSGKPRVLFLTRYDSFDAWEKDSLAQQKNSALTAALDRAGEADGSLLDSSDQNVFTYNEEFSLRPLADISGTHYLEIWVVHVRPGHYKEWSDSVKLAKSAFEKGVPTSHWAVYESAYGPLNGTYLFLTARKAAAELDREREEDKAFQAALGEDGLKKLDELFAASVESSESQFFVINPEMSYPDEAWVKADPEFWKPKAPDAPSTKATKKTESKP